MTKTKTYEIRVNIFRADGGEVEENHPGLKQMLTKLEKELQKDMNRTDGIFHLEVKSVEQK